MGQQTHETIKELRKRIAEIEEQDRQDRIARGLPPEPPPDFVGDTLSIALFHEYLEDFYPIAVRYVRIVSEGTYPKIDVDKLDDIKEYAELLTKSVRTDISIAATGVYTLIQWMRKLNDEDPSDDDVARVILQLSLCLSLMGVGGSTSRFYYDHRSDEVKTERYTRVRAEVEALRNDKDRLQAETDAAFKHYYSIRSWC